MMSNQMTVQELIQKELMQEQPEQNETLEILEFVKHNGVPLTDHQAQGLMILNAYGINDVANYVLNIRKQMTPVKRFFDMVNKLTLADRIKGNAKLAGILKANANPANTLNVDRALAKDVKY